MSITRWVRAWFPLEITISHSRLYQRCWHSSDHALVQLWRKHGTRVERSLTNFSILYILLRFSGLSFFGFQNNCMLIITTAALHWVLHLLLSNIYKLWLRCLRYKFTDDLIVNRRLEYCNFLLKSNPTKSRFKVGTLQCLSEWVSKLFTPIELRSFQLWFDMIYCLRSWTWFPSLTSLISLIEKLIVCLDYSLVLNHLLLLNFAHLPFLIKQFPFLFITNYKSV